MSRRSGFAPIDCGCRSAAIQSVVGVRMLGGLLLPYSGTGLGSVGGNNKPKRVNFNGLNSNGFGSLSAQEPANRLSDTRRLQKLI